MIPPVPILQAASNQDLKRLLELFPIAKLREMWPEHKGKKEEIGFTVAEGRDYDSIVRFIDENFSCCKQHAYVYSRPADLTELPDAFDSGERIKTTVSYSLYLVRSRYSVVLREPLEDTFLDFLWPIRVELAPGYLIVRFIVLEKNLSSYFDRPYFVAGRSADEKSILDEVEQLPIESADIHKGVRHLWDDGFMDAPRTKYKKAISSASEVMDEELGIKEHNPELYEILVDAMLRDTLFLIPSDRGTTLSAVLIDPSIGRMAFPRYSEKSGDTDAFIHGIIQHNQ